MKKIFQKYLPNAHDVQQHLPSWLHRFQHHNLWHLHRRSVAGGVAVGLFCGLIPGPLQMLGATGAAILLRVNLPVAIFSTLYTNPFTIVPLYWVAYQIGAWMTGAPMLTKTSTLALPDLHWHSWLSQLIVWFKQLGKPLLIGLPILAISLALLGYIAVRVCWRTAVLLQWQRRKTRGLSER